MCRYRDFRLSCRAVVAHPPLQLSHSLLKFAATAVGDHSTAQLYVINPQAEPQGTTQLFQFVPPDGSEISITPTGGQVLPGQVMNTSPGGIPPRFVYALSCMHRGGTVMNCIQMFIGFSTNGISKY